MSTSYMAGTCLLASGPWLLAGPDWAMTTDLNDERLGHFPHLSMPLCPGMGPVFMSRGDRVPCRARLVSAPAWMARKLGHHLPCPVEVT